VNPRQSEFCNNAKPIVNRVLKKSALDPVYGT